MSKKVIFIFILIISCSHKPDSVGEINEVVILTDSKDKFQVEPIVDEMFNLYVRTPQEEPKYKIKWAPIEKIDHYKVYSNLIILSIKETADLTVDLLFDRISEEYKIDNDIFSAKDVFARGQMVLCIRAYDAVDLKQKFISRYEWMFNEINSQINDNVRKILRNKKQNAEIQNMLLSNYGISGIIGEDYKIIKDLKAEKFLWIGRGYPYRWLIFNEIPGNLSNKPKYFWDLFVEQIKINMPDIIISDKFRESYSEKLTDGTKVGVLSGLYEHAPSDTGGPFFTYIIKADHSNSLILLSGFVNNPENEKYKLLKQLEVTIKDFTFNLKKEDG